MYRSQIARTRRSSGDERSEEGVRPKRRRETEVGREWRETCGGEAELRRERGGQRM